MNISIETIIVLITVILTGLTAGLCFTWTNAVTLGLGKLDDHGYLQAFQAMNRAIINPLFLVVFFGPFFAHLLNAYLMRTANTASFWVFSIAALLFILGVVLVTIFKNVPLNEMLDKTDLLVASKADLAALRIKFEGPWNGWHLVRTISSLLSFILLIIGMILANNEAINN